MHEHTPSFGNHFSMRHSLKLITVYRIRYQKGVIGYFIIILEIIIILTNSRNIILLTCSFDCTQVWWTLHATEMSSTEHQPTRNHTVTFNTRSLSLEYHDGHVDHFP